jgi:hypothetical protein
LPDQVAADRLAGSMGQHSTLAAVFLAVATSVVTGLASPAPSTRTIGLAVLEIAVAESSCSFVEPE